MCALKQFSYGEMSAFVLSLTGTDGEAVTLKEFCSCDNYPLYPHL